jgi:succinate dehydrogenase / fumarate reductase cytochrome b subunit
MSLAQSFTSSIGKKLVMGITGLFLISFLVVHVSVNAMIFVGDKGATFNNAAHFMSHNIVIRIMEIVLFGGLIAHIVQGLMLWSQNNAKRPVKYAVNKGNENSKWYSRSMGVLGTLLLMFLVLHLSHFWVETKANLYLHNDAETNTYEELKETFSQLWVVIVYVLGVASLAWHLLHGFQSAFQTLGLNHKKYTPIIKKLGVAFSIIVPLLFAAMPIYMYLICK